MPRPNRTFGSLWVIAAAMPCAAVLLLFLAKWNILTTPEAINLFLVAMLVLITAIYARESERSRVAMEEQARSAAEMAGETRQALLSSFQPIVVLGRIPAPREPLDKSIVTEQTRIMRSTYLYNVGPGPALNLHILWSKQDVTHATDTVPQHELRALGPAEAYELDLQRAFGEFAWSDHNLIVEYEDIFGGKFRSRLALKCPPQTYSFAVTGLFYERVS